MGRQSRFRSWHFSISRSFSRQTIKGRCPFACRKVANSTIQVLIPAQEVVALLNRIFMLRSVWERRHAPDSGLAKHHTKLSSLFPPQRDVGQIVRARGNQSAFQVDIFMPFRHTVYSRGVY